MMMLVVVGEVAGDRTLVDSKIHGAGLKFGSE